jgi:undecaprenyl-diphosphatase
VAGLSVAAAVEFSFLLGVVTLGAAAAWKSLHVGGRMLDAYGAPTLAVGFLAATLTAALAVEWLVRFVRTRSLAPFGLYRVLLAVLVAALLLAGTLPE